MFGRRFMQEVQPVVSDPTAPYSDGGLSIAPAPPINGPATSFDKPWYGTGEAAIEADTGNETDTGAPAFSMSEEGKSEFDKDNDPLPPEQKTYSFWEEKTSERYAIEPLHMESITLFWNFTLVELIFILVLLIFMALNIKVWFFSNEVEAEGPAPMSMNNFQMQEQ